MSAWKPHAISDLQSVALSVLLTHLSLCNSMKAAKRCRELLPNHGLNIRCHDCELRSEKPEANNRQMHLLTALLSAPHGQKGVVHTLYCIAGEIACLQRAGVASITSETGSMKNLNECACTS